MTLAPGTIIGPYKLAAAVGAGGMGVVWAAEDQRLRRRVALKFLPANLSADASAIDRFRREAQAASALNHPNICTVHDLGAADDGQQFIVMELMDGETLRSRLGNGPVAAAQAVSWAADIARGLHAAHAKGIVHRDLKPENLFVTTDGHIKILDFGLAKLAAPEAPFDDETQTALHTTPGVVLGTVGYMAPEQVRGETADSRADIFALGATLYEMLTGRRAFHASSAAETMHAILQVDPVDPVQTGSSVSPALARTLRRCLEKRPDRRFQSAGDLAFALETLSGADLPAPADAAAPIRSLPARRNWLPWMVAAAVALAAVIYVALSRQRSANDDAMAVLSLLPPEGSSLGTFAVSPDGQWLAFTESSSARRQLSIRRLDASAPRRLPGTDGAKDPFWSPDSSSVGFFAEGQLKVIAVAGGPPRSLGSVQQSRGGSWNRNGEIIFAPNLTGPLRRVAAAGGTPQDLTTLDKSIGQSTHRWPVFLPDGQHFLYFVRTTHPDHDGVYVGALDGTPGRRLIASSTNAIYAAGTLLFVRDGTLMAQTFDAGSQSLSGTAKPLVDKVGYALHLNRAALSASETGVLVYGGDETTRPTWFDRRGERRNAIGEPNYYAQLWLSPNGARVALDRPDTGSGANDIVVIDVARGGIPTRLSVDPGSDVRPVWMGDDRVVWASNRGGGYGLFQKPASGGGEETMLFTPATGAYPTSGSRDGRWLLYESATGPSADIWLLPMEGAPVPCRVLSSDATERQGRLSPGGRWIAYATDRDGSVEIYVTDATTALAAAARRPASGECPAAAGVRVSQAGGTQPIWRSDSSELFYLAADGRLMTVPFAAGAAAQPGLAAPLFPTRLSDDGGFIQTFAPSTDGQSFLIITPTRVTEAATVVMNWTRWLDPRAQTR